MNDETHDNKNFVTEKDGFQYLISRYLKNNYIKLLYILIIAYLELNDSK